jgi:copper chaperone
MEADGLVWAGNSENSRNSNSTKYKTMKTTLQLENIKCGGCANTLLKTIHSYSEISEASVNAENGEVQFSHPESFKLSGLKRKLRNLGYPVKGSVKGLEKMAASAISYASCAIGKISS